jgi:hypothetical protein
MFCPQCGAPNEDDSIFCGNCGAVLDPDAEPIEMQEGVPDQGLEPEPGAESLEKVLAVAPEEQAVPGRGPASYEQPGSYAPPAVSPPTSGMAIVSLVLGISGLTIFPFLGSILAVILGYMARNEIRRRPDEMAGEGLAVAGIVTGWIGVGLAVLSIVAVGGFFLCGLCGAFGANTTY